MEKHEERSMRTLSALVIFFAIICVLLILRYEGVFPIYRFVEVPDDKVCVDWSKPIPSISRDGNYRYCKKAIDYDDDFNSACYWNYDCSIYSEWREDYLGVPPSCLFMGVNYSYWGASPTSRFKDYGK